MCIRDSLPALRSPRPLPRLLLSFSSGCVQESGTGDWHRHDDPSSPPPTTTQSSAAHVSPCSSFAAAVSTAAAIAFQRVGVGSWNRRPPPPRRPTVATDDDNTAFGSSPPSPLSVHRGRCNGCCHLLAAGAVKQAESATAAATTTDRRHRRQQHSRRPLTSLPDHRSPPLLPHLLLTLCLSLIHISEPTRPY